MIYVLIIFDDISFLYLCCFSFWQVKGSLEMAEALIHLTMKILEEMGLNEVRIRRETTQAARKDADIWKQKN